MAFDVGFTSTSAFSGKITTINPKTIVYPLPSEKLHVNPAAFDAFGIEPSAHLVPVMKKRKTGPQVTEPFQVAKHVRGLGGAPVERMLVVLLDQQNRVIGIVIAAQGTLNESVIHPREIFAPAVEARARSVILVHNHPSGNLDPSREDIRATERLLEASKLLQIPLIDHIIVTDEDHTSIRQLRPELWIA